MAMVFTTLGINFDIEQVQAFHQPVTQTMADITDHDSAPATPARLDAEQKHRNGWYLKNRQIEREEEAKAKGAGHRAYIILPTDDKVSVITSSYGRGVRLDESVIESKCGNWLRLMSPIEHCKVKGLPVSIINGIGKTIAHRLLGNSVTYKPWEALGQVLSSALKQWAAPQKYQQAA